MGIIHFLTPLLPLFFLSYVFHPLPLPVMDISPGCSPSLNDDLINIFSNFLATHNPGGDCSIDVNDPLNPLDFYSLDFFSPKD